MDKIVGVICAGGAGERMLPLTQVTNKHLLPVYNKPMICYPLKTLVEAGIDEIMIVTGGSYSGGFLQLLGDGEKFGVRRLQYTYQNKPRGGIADALSCAEFFAKNKKVVMILGDNVFDESISSHIADFIEQGKGARVFLKEVIDTNKYGIAEVLNGRIVSMEEKPTFFKSNLAMVGLYMYDEEVFEMIRQLVPSSRGELEITDLNKKYLSFGKIEYGIIKGFWSDCGSFDTLYHTSVYIKEKYYAK